MADYYPLISRAVGALEKNSGENRRAIYDRARAALLAQLRGVTPPLDESDITRERLALEESIRKVEAESARQFVEAARQMPAAKVRQFRQWDTSSKARSTETRPAEPRRLDEADGQEARQQHYVVPPPVASPEGAPASQELPRRAAPPPPRGMPDAEQSDSIFDRPLPPEPQPVTQTTPETSPPAAGERRSFFSAFAAPRWGSWAARKRKNPSASAMMQPGRPRRTSIPALVPMAARSSTTPSRGASSRPPRKSACLRQRRDQSAYSSHRRQTRRIRARISPSRCWSRRSRSMIRIH